MSRPEVRRDAAVRRQRSPAIRGRGSRCRRRTAATGRSIARIAARPEYTVIRDAVNRVTKLEKRAEADGVRALVDGATVDLVVMAG